MINNIHSFTSKLPARSTVLRAPLANDIIKHYALKDAPFADSAFALSVIQDLQEKFGLGLTWCEAEHHAQQHSAVVILVGNGNTAATGFWCASDLLVLDYLPEVYVYPVVPVSDNEQVQQARNFYLQQGGLEIDHLPPNTTVIIDALLGNTLTGTEDLDSPAMQTYGQVVADVQTLLAQTTYDCHDICQPQLRKEQRSLVISLNMPALLNANSGQVVGERALKADCTYVQFISTSGCSLGLAKDYCGEVTIIAPPDVAFYRQVLKEEANAKYLIRYLEAQDVCSLFPHRSHSVHKGDVGKVVLIGGNKGMTGALRLCAQACLRTGAGLICALPLSDSATVFNVAQPELLTAKVKELSTRINWAEVVAIGPGLGRTEKSKQVFSDTVDLVRKNDIPLVIDADGLFFVAKLGCLDLEQVILTPHVGEAAMLLNVTIAQIMADPLQAAFDIALRYHCVCVLKSAITVVAYDGMVFITPTGCNGMASGGMGDLLTGIIAGLLAQTKCLCGSALVGVFVHGSAGQLVAQSKSQIGICASDLLPMINQIVSNNLIVND